MSSTELPLGTPEFVTRRISRTSNTTTNPDQVSIVQTDTSDIEGGRRTSLNLNTVLEEADDAYQIIENVDETSQNRNIEENISSTIEEQKEEEAVNKESTNSILQYLNQQALNKSSQERVNNSSSELSDNNDAKEMSDDDNNKNNMESILIGGRELKFETKFDSVNVIVAPTCTQKARMEMSPKDRDDLNRRAAQSCAIDKFCAFSKPKSPDKGDGVKAIYTFQSTQRAYRNNVMKYDMSVPFSIIRYNNKDDPTPLQQIDLFEKAHKF